MDQLLRRAKGLYIDRQRIALASMMIIFSISIILFYYLKIFSSFAQPPLEFPIEGVSGFQTVFILNTIGLVVVCILMALGYFFWSWAFLPSPATIYTMGILQGLFGPNAKIKRRIGKRFRISIDENKHIDVLCKIKDRNSDEWFMYHFLSSSVKGEDLKNIALRHGMTVQNNRFSTWVSSDELHHRLILLVKALSFI
jgi:hypothetical protein